VGGVVNSSGTGTNLKVVALVQSESGDKKFFGCAPPFYGSKSTISRFGERFRDGQYSLVSFLLAVLLTVPPCPAICKSGGTCSPCPMESASCIIPCGCLFP